MYRVLLVIFLIIAIALIAIIIMHQGKGTDMGASFGAGTSSNALFGSSGSTNFMTRTIAILATLFFCISMALSNINNNRISSNKERGSKWKNLSKPTEIEQSVRSGVPDKPTNDTQQHNVKK